jgi:hypothetical protein
MLEANYDQDKYEVTIYSNSGNIRDRLTGEILGDWVDWWTDDGSVSESCQRKLDLIENKFGVKINLR